MTSSKMGEDEDGKGEGKTININEKTEKEFT